MTVTRPGKILLVDDDYFIRDLISAAFLGQGCQIFHARSGAEALEIFQIQKPDAVVSDIVMPDGDGLWLCRQLREEGHKTPFIFLTQLKGLQDVNEAVQAGADAFFQKPIHPQELLDRLSEIVRST